MEWLTPLSGSARADPDILQRWGCVVCCCLLLSVVCCLLSVVCCLFSVLCYCLLSVIVCCLLLSVIVCCLLSVVCYCLLSVVCCLLSVVCCLLSCFGFRRIFFASSENVSHVDARARGGKYCDSMCGEEIINLNISG